MFSRHKRALCAFAAILAASLFAATPAHGQQAAAYQTRFDDASGWDLDNYFGVQWGVDATPIAGSSAANSLNYNNGTDYATGDAVYGRAVSPLITIGGAPSANLTFRCRFQTEDSSQDPFGREADLRFLFVMNSAGEFLAGVEFTGGTCGAMDQWHDHEFVLDPVWGSVNLVFAFDSVDGAANNYQGWFIDDLAVEVPDVTPPAAVINLAAGSPTFNSVTVTWSSPADDDTSGAAASFDLRYSTSPITSGNFSSAIPVGGEPAPGSAGTSHQMAVPGLVQATSYYFALRTTDKSGNVSALSNVASAATLAPIPAPDPGSSSGSKKDNDTACSAGSAAGPGALWILACFLALAATRMIRCR